MANEKYVFPKDHTYCSRYFQPLVIRAGSKLELETDGMYRLHNNDGKNEWCRFPEKIVNLFKDEKLIITQ